VTRERKHTCTNSSAETWGPAPTLPPGLFWTWSSHALPNSSGMASSRRKTAELSRQLRRPAAVNQTDGR